VAVVESDRGDGEVAFLADWFTLALGGVVHSVGFLHGSLCFKETIDAKEFVL
jgi:hypothetical protein